MASMSGALTVLCLAAGLLHLFRLVVLRGDVAGEAAHAGMGLGMAAMLCPLGDPVPEAVWPAVFLLCAAWFATRLLRGDGAGGEAVHHVVGSAAMLLMLAAGHPGGHDSHDAESGGVLGGAVGLVPVTAMLLAGYFGWHALRCADRYRPGGSPDPLPLAVTGDATVVPDAAVALRAPAPTPWAPRAAAVAHLVMAVAMTTMLLSLL